MILTHVYDLVQWPKVKNCSSHDLRINHPDKHCAWSVLERGKVSSTSPRDDSGMFGLPSVRSWGLLFTFQGLWQTPPVAWVSGSDLWRIRNKTEDACMPLLLWKAENSRWNQWTWHWPSAPFLNLLTGSVGLPRKGSRNHRNQRLSPRTTWGIIPVVPAQLHFTLWQVIR